MDRSVVAISYVDIVAVWLTRQRDPGKGRILVLALSDRYPLFHFVLEHMHSVVLTLL